MDGDPTHVAEAAARTLRDAGIEAFGETVRLSDVLAATVDVSGGKAPLGPRTVDPRVLPMLATAQASDPSPQDADLVVVEVLGEGGMGIVELARQRSLSRDVALKRARQLAEHSGALLREAVYTGFLEHPNIVPVHALGRDERERPLLVMKKIEGTTLAAMLRDPAHASWKRSGGDRLAVILRALRAVCDALAFAHSRGVLHRDVKPENVMLGAFGEVYLLDWGVAHRLGDPLDPGAIVGTPAYLAPEMLRPTVEEIDERTDVYLVGATLHECLVGSPPHQGETMMQVLLAAARSKPHTYPSDVPEELADVARRAMHADRSARHPSAAALGEALAEVERHRAASAIADAAEQRLTELEERIAKGALEAEVEPIFHECRFGFEQALRAWPTNVRVRAALQRASTKMCRFHVARANRAAAAALLATLDPAPKDLADAVEALTREEARASEDRARLKHLEHDLDATVGAKERGRAARLMGLAILLLVTIFTIGYTRYGFRPSAATVLFVSLPGVVIIGTIAMRFRRHFFRNRANRQLALTFVFGVLAILVDRATGYARGRSLGDVTAGDALIISALAGVSALSLRRIYLVPSALFMIVALVSPWIGGLAFFPTLAAAAISLAAIVFGPASLNRPLLSDAPASRRDER